MRVLNKLFAGVIAAGVGVTATAAFAGDIRVGITMRMISENGQAYGQMVMDEIKGINDAGGINGNMIEATLMNDECKSDKGVANANKMIFQEKVHLLIGSSCSSVTLPIVDVTAKAGVPQMVPHSTNSKITQKGSEWVFRIPVSGRYYGGVNAKYVGENIGTKIAYICAADAASVGDCANMEKQMRARFGAEPAYRADVQEKEVDFRSHMQKIKSMDVDGILVAALAETMARALVQSYEAGIGEDVRRIGSSSASNAPVPKIAGDAAKGVFFTAAYAAADNRPIAKLFNEMTRQRYGIHAPDHDFSQAYDLVRIMEIALKNADLDLSDGALAADRTAIRDAIANVEGYEGLASGPISFCAAPTPQCRDGNRTAVLIGYTKGGENFETEVLARVTMEPDFGLE
ncbi:MAG: ABC transporter substrate-binding protein [SAR116 cluster bacterium]|jgi:branched-chain amino acid transport system substrate-binding protein|nr:ABC transporter substrate-binding protein [Gammaproteobacteria bacterium]MCH2554322.1 ABC transporter substrate-binding protein [SAR116 cluster bacterium]MCH2563506.1 ABC transporter substrate-binding protein [SAR116 cluster bacterium]GIR51042.1 MAG: ABC transporter substrate-binding protein [Alphaproteobacteria bacterium]